MSDNQAEIPAKTPWPKDRTQAANAVMAFSATLTRAGRDQTFRDSLKRSLEDARNEVSNEGKIEIPEDIVILFHEPEACQNIFPFYLPKPDDPLRAFSYYFQGCRPKFQFPALSPAVFFAQAKERFAVLRVAPAAGEAETKKPWTLPNIAEAFTAVLHRSQVDPDFRRRLTASMSSAKDAVAVEGGIDIPAEVLVLFHEDEANEKFHMFRLPPLDPNGLATYEYRPQFEGFYFVW
jgi:hypothetical protein